MTQENLQKEFNEFVSSHPTGLYEEWIGTLHPEAKEKCLLEGLGGEILIDQDYYSEDNEHRNIWNAALGGKRMQVPASPFGSDAGDSQTNLIVDLIGDGEAISAPTSPCTLSPNQDILSFN